jgi:uncharacterized membrane protein YtjA (UPF0391 family)
MTRIYAVALVFFEVRLISGVLGFDGSIAATETIIWICLALAIPLADVIPQIQDSWRARPPARARDLGSFETYRWMLPRAISAVPVTAVVTTGVSITAGSA